MREGTNSPTAESNPDRDVLWLLALELRSLGRFRMKSESVKSESQSTVMAARHSLALRVQFDDRESTRLKAKLTKYFQSKRSSGGDCEVDHEPGSGTAVVRFLKAEGKNRRGPPAGLTPVAAPV